MRLLTRYNRINLLTIVIVMLVTGVIYYYTVSKILTNQVDKDLVVEENEIFEHVRLNHNLPQVYGSDDQLISFSPAFNTTVTRRFLDTTFKKAKDDRNEECEAGRGLVSSVKVNGKNYRISVIESKVETDDLIRIIFGITAAVILLLVLSILIINRLIIKRLWQPFYKILSQLKVFNIADKTEAKPVLSDTDEFNELNNAIMTMWVKAKSDYSELKSFTENASHELMTPIAVINSQLDTLLQAGSFDENQSNILSDVYESMARLTRLNRSMLLLVKIEHNMLQDLQDINIKSVIEKLLNQLQELYADKGITVTTNLIDKNIRISKSLLEVLLNNLLVNAIRHNHKDGTIHLELNNESLVISNTAKYQAEPIGDIFKRFNKSDQSEGTGLGLTIVKQICDNYGLGISHNLSAGKHTFTIAFPSEK